MAKAKMPEIPGFTAVNDYLLVREPSESTAPGDKTDANQPTVVALFGWGDGLPKHVAKYAEGYRVLYPHAKQVVVISPIRAALFSTLEQRAERMRPVNEIIFPQDAQANPPPGHRVLCHVMSNTGAINWSSALYAYRQDHGRSLPHSLVVMDSTPGSTDLTLGNLERWSRAMTMGLAAYLPWPAILTQFLCSIFLVINRAFEKITRRPSAGEWAGILINQDKYLSRANCHRLFLYSKEDDLIGYQDIEAHAAESKAVGCTVETEMFQGSKHVGHMRQDPEKYWRAIATAWARAVLATS